MENTFKQPPQGGKFEPVLWKTLTDGSPVTSYCEEEVGRQGHNTYSLDGIERVGWMLDGWAYALARVNSPIRVEDVKQIGMRVERLLNARGFRQAPVWIGDREGIRFDLIEPALEELLERQHGMDSLDFYRAILIIHPFLDGNGRSSKCLLNWHRGSLLAPVFPPKDFWGKPIANP